MYARRSRFAKLGSGLRAVGEWLFAKEWDVWHWIAAALWLAALLAVQWKVGQGFIAQGNLDVNRMDQGAYLDLARSNAAYLWPTYSDGIRAPLFPFLIKAWSTNDEAQFFAAAKQANVCFGLVATTVLALFFLWKLPFLPALNVGTVSALIILPASAFATAEVVYYVALFFFWIVGWRLIVENPLKKYALAGLLCGVAYLAKPSTLLLGICLVLLSLGRWWQIHRTREEDWRWNARRFGIGAVVFYVCFLLPGLPKAYNMQLRAGDPFQNASQYCFWMDDWNHCVPLLPYFSAKHIQELPKEARPSPMNYWRQHTLAQMEQRMTNGMAVQAHNFILAEKTVKAALHTSPKLRTVLPFRGAYPLALLLATLLLATQRPTVKPRTLADRRALWALAACGLALHFLAFSFYTPIAGGDRFILAAYIPVLFSLALGLEYLSEERAVGWRVGIVRMIQVLMATQLVWQLIHISTATAFAEPRGTI